MTKREQAERAGRTAEWAAILALALSGHSILGRRVRTGAGEIDLIIRRGGALAFVEVKSRPDVEDALAAVGARQRARIERAASLWCARRPWASRLQWRYDVVAVAPGRWPVHIRDAWRPEEDPFVATRRTARGGRR